jgi:hypothetical protein
MTKHYCDKCGAELGGTGFVTVVAQRLGSGLQFVHLLHQTCWTDILSTFHNGGTSEAAS